MKRVTFIKTSYVEPKPDWDNENDIIQEAVDRIMTQDAPVTIDDCVGVLEMKL